MRLPKLLAVVLSALSLLTLSFGQNPLGYDFVRTEGTSITSTGRSIAYDSGSKKAYTLNQPLNQVDIIDVPTRKLVGSIRVPEPIGLDVSADGLQLAIASQNGYAYLADVASRTLKSRFAVGSQLQDILFLSDGTLLVNITGFPNSGLGLIDPQTAVITPLSLTSNNQCCFDGKFFRSGDHTKVAVLSGNQVWLLDSANHSVIANKTYDFTSTVNDLQVDRTGSTLYVEVTNNFARFASVLNGALIEQRQINNVPSGVILSNDGKVLFGGGAITGDSSIFALDSTTGATLANYSDLNPAGSLPRAVTEDNILIGRAGDGIAFIDTKVAQHTPADLFLLGSRNGLLLTPVFGLLAGDTQVNFGGPSVTGVPQVTFGDVFAPSVSLGGQFAQGFLATTPASSTQGPVPVTAQLSNGVLQFIPEGFSYGPKILRVRTPAGTSAGGNSISILGYGFGDAPSVTVGGQPAAQVSLQPFFGSFGSSVGSLQELMVTAPAGTVNTSVDVVVSTAEGNDTAAGAYTYANVQTYPYNGTGSWLAYDASRNLLYISNGTNIERFDAQSRTFLTHVQPSTVVANSAFQGIALTPDNSKLIIADHGANLLHIVDASTFASTAIQTGTAVNSGPTSVAATSNGKVFFSPFLASPQQFLSTVGVLNLSDNSLGTIPAEYAFFVQQGSTLFSTADGSSVYMGNLFKYDAAADRYVTLVLDFGAAGMTSLAPDGSYFLSGLRRFGTGATLSGQSLSDDTFWFPGFFTQSQAQVIPPNAALAYSFFDRQISGPLSELSLDGYDVNTGRLVQRFTLPEFLKSASFPSAQEMVTDSTGKTIFLPTVSGLTVVDVPAQPLTVLSVNGGSAVSSAGGNTVILKGSGFQSSATVRIGATDITATVLSDAQISFVTPATAAGEYPITVINPNGSYTLPFGYIAKDPIPAPTLSSLNPTSFLVGDSNITFTITGTNFTPQTQVFSGNVQLTSTFVSATQIQVTPGFTFTTQAGIHHISVANPAPGGGQSNTLDLPTNNPVPGIFAVFPNPVITGTTNLDVLVNATGVVPGTTAFLDGQPRVLTGSQLTVLRVTLLPSDVATDGTHQLTLQSPAPGGGTSAAFKIVVQGGFAQATPDAFQLFFDFVNVGQTSFPRLNNIRNTGNQPLVISSVSLTGPYALTNPPCAASLLPGEACGLSVVFKPTVAGLAKGSLTITSNDPLSPLVIPLTGQGNPFPHAVYSATSLDFGNVPVATASNTQTITISNDGSADLIVNSITLPDGAPFLQTNNCTTVKTASSCTVAAVYKPTAAGPNNTQVLVNTSAGTQPISLAGNGTDLSIGNGGGTGTPSSTVKAGSPAQYTLALAPQGGFSGTVSFACSNLPAHASCVFNPTSANLSSAANITVTINTEDTKAASLSSSAAFYAALPLCGLFGLLPVLRARKELRTKPYLWTLALVLLLATVAGPLTACGGGGGGTGGTPSTPPPQPQVVTAAPGTYTVTFTATGGGVSRSTNLQLVVQ